MLPARPIGRLIEHEPATRERAKPEARERATPAEKRIEMTQKVLDEMWAEGQGAPPPGAEFLIVRQGVAVAKQFRSLFVLCGQIHTADREPMDFDPRCDLIFHVAGSETAIEKIRAWHADRHKSFWEWRKAGCPVR